MMRFLAFGLVVFGLLLIGLSSLLTLTRPEVTSKTYLKFTTVNGKIYYALPDASEVAFVGYDSASPMIEPITNTTAPQEVSNGEWVIYWNEEGVFRMPAQGEGSREVLGAGLDIENVSASPDKNWLALIVCMQRYYGSCTIEYLTLANVSEGDFIRLTNATLTDNNYLLSWSPDGRWLLFFSGQAASYLSFENGQVSHTHPLDLPADILEAGWLDGTWLYFVAQENSKAGIYRLRFGEPSAKPEPILTRTPFSQIYKLRFSMDGKWLLFKADYGTSYIVSSEKMHGQVIDYRTSPMSRGTWTDKLPEKAFHPAFLHNLLIIALGLGLIFRYAYQRNNGQPTGGVHTEFA